MFPGLLFLAAPAPSSERALPPVMRRSDVVLMGAADRQAYRDYGAAIVAWGGKPTPEALRQAEGVRYYASVGMVTEFGQYATRFPKNYQEGFCKDINGEPVKVPWLTDLSHNGVPYYWCCTNQPRFRTYLRDRVTEIARAGAFGLHIDDHLGTAGGLWLGLCFCDRCLQGFRGYLAALPEGEKSRLGIADIQSFDYAAEVREWMSHDLGARKSPTQHPLWDRWSAYQCRAAAELVAELKKLAEKTSRKPMPLAANAGLLWPRHLSDSASVDLFSAETDHQAAALKACDDPIFAYRMADAVGKPYAATAAGGDWAFIKQRERPGLVRMWIALAYACGQAFMPPIHQWCYTPELGTHWYDGSRETYMPIYQFIHDQAALLDGYRALADVALVVPHRSFCQDPARWIGYGRKLAEANLAYRLVLGGDEILDRSLAESELNACKVTVVPDRDSLSGGDSRRAAARLKSEGGVTSVDAAIRQATPAVRVLGNPRIRVLPRARRGSLVVHLLNTAYAAGRDDVVPASDVKVRIDVVQLGLASARTCRLVSFGRPVQTLPITGGEVVVPSLGIWSMLVIGK